MIWNIRFRQLLERKLKQINNLISNNKIKKIKLKIKINMS